ncbi:MAG: UbiA family prenyltransferase [Paludibacterium sp.]|uniref:UbiA family prenyltransferase n=1 Tax=Paludibacterium sp. TaxID=1917523 RepID=UPI0025D0C64D|nr:UbiA family prenyltransferase [Paludibacterium sp.]MBV8049070.1 UbiA family prenyltransferase [Paludibacterium sp.]MBV8649420.1 UbiA family prenyltransferase [Paludibacterium sp.]
MNLRALSIDTAGFIATNRLHIALMPVVMTAFWNQALGLPLGFGYYLMIVLTTAGGYFYNIYTDAEEDSVNYNRRYRVLDRNAQTRALIAVCFIGGFLLSLCAGWRFVLYGGVVHWLGTCYSRPLPFRYRGRSLRIKEIPVLKNLYAGLFWSLALVLTPYLYAGATPGAAAVQAIALSFLLDYFVELLWDIRDMPGDAKAGFNTVPLWVGERATYGLLGLVHLSTCALMAWGAVSRVLTPGCLLFAVVHLPVGLWFLAWFRRQPEKDWASHWYILYGGSLLAAGMVWTRFLTLES